MTSEFANVAGLYTLALVIARCAGLFLVAPVFASPAVPIRLRLAISVVIGLAVAGGLSAAAQSAPAVGAAALGLAIAVEVAVGALVGYLARLVFVGVELAAMHIGQQMGVGLAEVFDPLKEDGSQSVGGLLQMTALVVFLAIGGHRAMIAALAGTFDVLPPRMANLASVQAAMRAAVAMLTVAFVLALKLAAPVLAAILMTTAAGGMLQKTLPQLNILTVGLPVRVIVGLAVLAASLAVLWPLLDSAIGALTREWIAAFAVAR